MDLEWAWTTQSNKKHGRFAAESDGPQTWVTWGVESARAVPVVRTGPGLSSVPLVRIDSRAMAAGTGGLRHTGRAGGVSTGGFHSRRGLL